MEGFGRRESACGNHTQATEPEKVLEYRYTRPGLVRDASEECVRGVTAMRHVVKPPAKASKLLVVQGGSSYSSVSAITWPQRATRSTGRAGSCQ